MPVRSEEYTSHVNGSSPKPPRRPRPSRLLAVPWDLIVAKGALWIVALTLGGVVFATNGGFSALGAGVVASSFNDAGKLFWANVTAWTFRPPVTVAGISGAQPVIPWVFVAAASVLQITLLYRKLAGKDVPLWLTVSAILLSIYDFGTTFFGLGTVPWVAAVGWWLQALGAIFFAFAFETTISYLLPKAKPAA